MNDLSQIIKDIRKYKGLSQEEFALIIGVSRQTVVKWEKGVIQPTTKNILTVCEKMNISPEQFFNGEDDMQALLQNAQQQADVLQAQAEHKAEKIKIKYFLSNVALVASFTVLGVTFSVLAIILISVLAPSMHDFSRMIIHINTSPQYIVFYVFAFIINALSAIVAVRFFTVKIKKKKVKDAVDEK